jgi:23S rRNA (adenine1618-N6)-methyltransferase
MPNRPAPKPGPHPRNPHRERYDFPRLVAACPELRGFVRGNPLGEPTIDFADPRAVRALNRALLAAVYGIQGWDIPEGYLCPPIPGRADYLHHLADLLAAERGGRPPRGAGIRALDIGTGANLVYPLIGHRAYGWTFVGTDVDPRALANAAAILAANPGLAEAVELRLQKDGSRLFEGVVRPGERFDVCLCNPPFHESADQARAGSLRKWRNLGRPGAAPGRAPVLNFGGQGGELWCPGGEAAFVGRMVQESARRPDLCAWFTSLVSRSENLPRIRAALREAGAARVRVVEMAQGQKRSRIVAWSFRAEGAEAPGAGAAQ